MKKKKKRENNSENECKRKIINRNMRENNNEYG